VEEDSLESDDEKIKGRVIGLFGADFPLDDGVFTEPF